MKNLFSSKQTAKESRPLDYPGTLMLYHSPSCPFCRRVSAYLAEQGISVPEKDLSQDSAARAELIAIGGKGQVPCLVIDGKPLYESMDIIAWFDKQVKSV